MSSPAPKFLKLVITTLLAMCVGSLLGCSKAAPQELSVDIVIEHLKPTDSWRVTYRASQPVRGFVFLRQKSQFRAQKWKVTSGNAFLEVAGGRERLIGRGGASTIQLEFPTDPSDIPNDYRFFTRFSDGGVLMHAGHLQVIPLLCSGSCREDGGTEAPQTPVRYVFAPSAGEQVVIDGRSSFRSIGWSGGPDGAYAYFGRQEPRNYGRFRAIVDPSLPVWITRELNAYAPLFLTYFERKTGFKLRASPIMFLSAAKSSRPGESAQGSVVNHQVSIALSGDRWLRQSSARTEKFLQVLAHELAHLWNGSLFKPEAKPGAEWLHEGGAEAFAYRALLDNGLISFDRYKHVLVEQLNRCISGVSGIALHDSEAADRVKNYYHCGATIALVTESAIKGARRDDDLFEFWRELFTRSLESGGVYTEQSYLALMNERSQRIDLRPKVLELLQTPVERADRYFLDLLRGVGVEARFRTRDLPGWYNHMMGERAIQHIVNQDCKGRGYYSLKEDYIQVLAASSCSTIQEDIPVGAVGNYHIYEEGAFAFDLVREQCREDRSAQLWDALYGGLVRVKCEPFPTRPFFVNILGL